MHPVIFVRRGRRRVDPKCEHEGAQINVEIERGRQEWVIDLVNDIGKIVEGIMAIVFGWNL